MRHGLAGTLPIGCNPAAPDARHETTMTFTPRLLAVLLCALLLATCSHREGGGYVIGFIGKAQSNEVFVTARRGAEAEAKRLAAELGVEISVVVRTPANENAQAQADAIEQLVREGAQAITVSCSNAEVLTGAIDAAVAKGVPVMCFDSDAPASKRFCFFGTDDVPCGRAVMKELAALMKDQGKVAVLAGNQNAPNLQKRTAGVKEELAKHPGIKLAGVYYHPETPQDAAAKVNEIQRLDPEITGWAMIGGWPLFTGHALDLVKGRAQVVAVDMLPPELEYVKSGEVQVLLGQPCFEWGVQSVRLLIDKIHRHRDPPLDLPATRRRRGRRHTGLHPHAAVKLPLSRTAPTAKWRPARPDAGSS